MSWTIPLISAIILSLLLTIYMNDIVFFGSGALINKIFSLLSILPGFFIAALSIVSSYKNDILDKSTLENIKITILIKGKKVNVPLTKRKLMTSLFSYLTFSSLFTCILSIILNICAPIMTKLSPNINFYGFFTNYHIILFFVLLLYFYFFSQIIMLTLWGLYFLSDLIHDIGK